MRTTLLPAIVLAAALLTVSAPAFAAIVNEPMTGSTAPGWVIGGSAYLSASTGVDAAGNGWLRLTEPLNNQAGFAFFDSPFDISQGVVIQFDYATWGGNGADGYSIFLFDGSYDSSTFVVGASGGSLGYDKKTVAPIHAGLTGGYLGVGIDEYGNFSNPTEGRIGGPGQQANEVGVRGPFDHPSGAYDWLGGSGTLGTQLAFNNQMYRPAQNGVQYRKVVIYLTPVAAPNYLRVDTYVQFGFNQPLTPVVTGLFVARPVPTSVKIGYAASTGGSTNYHEIRNLVIDPLQTDIDLAMTKVVSSPSVTVGGPITYTVTARNYGPANVTATNVPITDTIPALVTGATWTCVGTNGGTCGSASGAGNLNTTATLPFNGSVSYTIRGTVSAAAPLGTALTNTATLTPPAGITDYNNNNDSATAVANVTGPPVSISGLVYSDANHNGTLDGGEVSPNIAGIYAKLFRTSDMNTALQAVLVTQATGAYTFNNVPSYDTYTVILSTNNTLTDQTAGFPNANWIYTSPLNYTLSNLAVTNANLTNQNFGVYNGSRISGKVINDNGYNGPAANANDGVLNAAESGVPGVTVRLANNTGGTTYDTDVTGSGGEFVLFTNAASATLRIYETNLAGYLSVSYNPGNTAGTYTMGGEYISFAYTRYGNNGTGGYKNVLFGDVQDNTFAPTPLALNGAPNTAVYYGHTFTPGSGGQVSFSVTSRTQGSWPAVVLYRDVNCNGNYDSLLDQALPASLTANAGTPICILVKDTIPAGAGLATTDQIVTRATFTFTNSVGPVTGTYNVTDTTTVAMPGASVNVSGMVFNDANHNSIRDVGENSPNIAAIYAKLFRSGDLVTALSVTTVNQATGAYLFTLVPTSDTYTVILSTTNNTGFDPSFPSTQWVFTSPANYSLAGVVVGGSDVTNQNFGVFNGTRVDGTVLKDDGGATGTNANNGAQNAGETGIAGQTVSICDNSSCTAIDTEITDGNGYFALYVPWATNFATARVTQTTMPANYSLVNYGPGNAAGSAVNLAARSVTFTFTRGAETTGLVFSDVPDNAFTPTPLAQNGAPATSVYYAHSFTPGSGGQAGFSVNSRTRTAWAAVELYQDTNCSGTYDAGDAVIGGSVSMTAGTPFCMLVKDTVLASAPSGTTDQIVTRATFTFTNSSGPVVRVYDVTDTTTVLLPNLSTSTKAWTDLNGGSLNAGDTLQYTITLTETAGMLASNVTVTDTIPANISDFTVVSIPPGATDSSTPGGAGVGLLNITNISVPANSSVTVVVNMSISGSAAPGSVISNTALATLPGAGGTTLTAANATVVAATGNKPLYLYSAPTYTLSRTPTSGAPASVPISPGASQSWNQLPAAAGTMTIDPVATGGTNAVPVILQVARSTAGTSGLTVSLQCQPAGAILNLAQNCAFPLEPANTTCTYNLPLAAAQSCSTYWRLTVQNNSGVRTVYVHPLTGGLSSRVVLPATTVIDVSSVLPYSVPYAGGNTTKTFYSGGDTVYVRAAVSDPFGSYDINANSPTTLPQVTIMNPGGGSVGSWAMSEIVSATTASTKTFEYAYTVPVNGPEGVWSASVTAAEGTEGTVTDTGIGTFRVRLLPSIVMVKSSQVISDPYNGSLAGGNFPKAIPNAVIQYTVMVQNSGNGTTDNASLVVTDRVPANTVMYVDTGSGNPVTFVCSAAPACGLAFNYATDVRYTDQSPLPALLPAPGRCGNFTYTPVGSYDANVKGFCINPTGSMNGNNASFNLFFKVMVQ